MNQTPKPANKIKQKLYNFFLIIKERKKKKYRIWKIYHQSSVETKEKCTANRNTKQSAETVSTSSNEDPTAAKMIRIQQ